MGTEGTESTETASRAATARAPREAAETALAALPAPAAATGADTSPMVSDDVDITGRTLWLTRMPYGGSRMLAAAFRSIGLDARVTPDEDARTLELGGKYTSGDECYPQRIVLGDYLQPHRGRQARPQEDRLPAAHRQRPLPLRPVRRRCCAGCSTSRACRTWPSCSITSADGYAGIGEQAGELIRTGVARRWSSRTSCSSCC